MCLAKSFVGSARLFLVLVEPDAEFAPSQSPFADADEKASTFLMVVSDCSPRYFTKRPTKDQAYPHVWYSSSVDDGCEGEEEMARVWSYIIIRI